MKAPTIPGMALAIAHGHAIFLDCAADRYFALSPDENEALLRLLAGATISARARRALTEATGVEASAEQFRLLMTAADCLSPSRSAITASRSGWLSRFSAIRHLVSTKMMLKTKGLHASLERLACAEAAAASHAPAESVRSSRIVGAHDWLSRHSTVNDACLERSLALAYHLRSSGCTAQLVIAVKADPFAAHCWVQSGHRLLNEDLDVAASFEPILIVR